MTECPVCGLPERSEHDACDDAQQVEPYDGHAQSPEPNVGAQEATQEAP